MDENLRSQIARLKVGGGTARASLSELANDSSLLLPPDYVAFMVETNGGEGFVGDGGYVQLWPDEEILPNNEALQVNEFAPSLVFFATDGGGEGYAFDRGCAPPRIVHAPLIGMADDSAYVHVGSTFGDLLDHIGRQRRSAAWA